MGLLIDGGYWPGTWDEYVASQSNAPASAPQLTPEQIYAKWVSVTTEETGRNPDAQMTPEQRATAISWIASPEYQQLLQSYKNNSLVNPSTFESFATGDGLDYDTLVLTNTLGAGGTPFYMNTSYNGVPVYSGSSDQLRNAAYYTPNGDGTYTYHEALPMGGGNWFGDLLGGVIQNTLDPFGAVSGTVDTVINDIGAPVTSAIGSGIDWTMNNVMGSPVMEAIADQTPLMTIAALGYMLPAAYGYGLGAGAGADVLGVGMGGAGETTTLLGTKAATTAAAMDAASSSGMLGIPENPPGIGNPYQNSTPLVYGSPEFYQAASQLGLSPEQALSLTDTSLGGVSANQLYQSAGGTVPATSTTNPYSTALKVMGQTLLAGGGGGAAGYNAISSPNLSASTGASNYRYNPTQFSAPQQIAGLLSSIPQRKSLSLPEDFLKPKDKQRFDLSAFRDPWSQERDKYWNYLA